MSSRSVLLTTLRHAAVRETAWTGRQHAEILQLLLQAQDLWPTDEVARASRTCIEALAHARVATLGGGDGRNARAELAAAIPMLDAAIDDFDSGRYFLAGADAEEPDNA